MNNEDCGKRVLRVRQRHQEIVFIGSVVHISTRVIIRPYT